MDKKNARLAELEREASMLRLAYPPKAKRARQAYEHGQFRLADLRREIDALSIPAPFPTRDNGVHVYYETSRVLVLRNHGSAYWTSMVKAGKSHQVIISGSFDAIFALKAAEEAAAAVPASLA